MRIINTLLLTGIELFSSFLQNEVNLGFLYNFNPDYLILCPFVNRN